MRHILLLSLLLFFCSTEQKIDALEQSNSNTTSNAKPQSDLVSKILFAKRGVGSNGWSIFMMNPDGTNEEVLIPLKSGQGEYNPDISPDGKTVVFNTYRYGGWKLANYDLSSSLIKRISPTSNYYMNGVYSPDGSMIAYERNINRTVHIFVSDRNGENPKHITPKMGNQNRLPTWSKDGKSILFYSENGKSNDIYQVDLETGINKNLTNNTKGNDFNPSISPNGKKVAFYSDREGYLDVFIMDLSGKNQVNLTKTIRNKNNTYNYYKDDNMYWMFKVSWSPDGECLVFSNAVEDNIDLFTVKYDGTNLKQITKTVNSEFTPVWGMIENQ